MGIGYDIKAKGKFLARNNIGWSNMKAKIDMINGANSYVGQWTPTEPVPILSLELEGSATLSPFISAGLKFGVNILNGKLKVAAGLEVKASLPVAISASIETGNTGATRFQGCQGFNVTLEGKVEIYVLLEAGSLKKPFNITPEIVLPIFDKCIKYAPNFLLTDNTDSAPDSWRRKKSTDWSQTYRLPSYLRLTRSKSTGSSLLIFQMGR